MALPYDERKFQVGLIRKEAIDKLNAEKINRGDNPIRQRRKHMKSKASDVKCSKCKGVYGSKTLWKHRRYCGGGGKKAASTATSTAVPIKLKPGTLPAPSGDFYSDRILTRFRDDSVGKICQTDPLLKKYGREIYTGPEQNPVEIMKPMRLVGNVLHKYREKTGNKSASVNEMLHAKNWENIKSAIVATSTKSDHINLNTSQCLKQLIRGARADCLIGNTDESMTRATELSNLLLVMEVKNKQLYKSSNRKAIIQRKTVLQKPSQLPLHDDITKLKNHIDQKVAAICLKQVNDCKYEELRPLLVTRWYNGQHLPLS